MSRSRKGAIAPIVIGVVGVAILVWLGSWQVQRLAWKEGLIATLEARMSAEPVPLPAAPDAERDAYLKVALEGRIGTEELHVLTSIKRVGPGFRVIAPMDLEDGRRILVDLGFVLEKLKSLETRPDSVRLQPGGTHEVTGVLVWPNEVDSFTPEPDKGREIWFARDLPAMAEALGTEPVLVVAESHPDGETPLPRLPGVGLPNRHLEYALTWYGLAIVWTIMSIVWLRAELRKSRAAS